MLHLEPVYLANMDTASFMALRFKIGSTMWFVRCKVRLGGETDAVTVSDLPSSWISNATVTTALDACSVATLLFATGKPSLDISIVCRC